MITGILLVQAVAFAVLSGIVASNKNRDPAGWGVLGFLFGLFAFIAALVVEEWDPQGKRASSRRRSQSSNTREFDPDEHEKKCPDCAEYIKLEARVCKHCGREFSEENVNGEIRRRLEEQIGDTEAKNEEGEEVQDGIYYCERREITVTPTRDKITCPSCGRQLSDARHTYVEEEKQE